MSPWNRIKPDLWTCEQELLSAVFNVNLPAGPRRNRWSASSCSDSITLVCGLPWYGFAPASDALQHALALSLSLTKPSTCAGTLKYPTLVWTPSLTTAAGAMRRRTGRIRYSTRSTIHPNFQSFQYRGDAGSSIFSHRVQKRHTAAQINSSMRSSTERNTEGLFFQERTRCSTI
jgi:hypothetical protein